MVHGVNGDVTVTSGTSGTITETATLGDINMDGASTLTTLGGGATLTAGGNVALGQVNVSAGNIGVTATSGAISNNIGATSPPNLIGSQATLTSGTGVGSGASSFNTAIGTNLGTLIASSTTSGNIVIFEQGGLDLGAIDASSGTLEISADLLIQQIAGNPVLNATDALFTTKSVTIGTASVTNTNSLTLETSTVLLPLPPVKDVGSKMLWETFISKLPSMLGGLNIS